MLMRAGARRPRWPVINNPRLTPRRRRKRGSRQWCLEDSKDPVAILRMFGGWSGILNCERDGTDAFFSEQGGLNFLPAFLGGGDNGLLHGDLGNSLDTGTPGHGHDLGAAAGDPDPDDHGTRSSG